MATIQCRTEAFGHWGLPVRFDPCSRKLYHHER